MIDDEVYIMCERPAMLRYKYTAYLVVSSFGTSAEKVSHNRVHRYNYNSRRKKK